MSVPLIYRQQPLFGFDLGNHTAKLVQLRPKGKSVRVEGYGYAEFATGTIVEGIVVDPQEIVKAVAPLLRQLKFGRLTARRVAISLPNAKVFTRVLQLPPMNQTDLAAAVRYEAEQYIPVPLPDLYIDYEIVDQTKDQLQVLMVAAPRAIVDSYLKLFEMLGLEVIVVESSLMAVTRAVVAVQPEAGTIMVTDFGADSIDLSIYDSAVRLTNTVAIGGDQLTHSLVQQLGLDEAKASEIKRKFGLGPSGLQDKIKLALEPQLSTIVAEIKRVLKYYQEHSPERPAVSNIILTGGSAAMPGLADYLATQLGVKVQVINPWSGLVIKDMPAASKSEAALYTTALGLARLEGAV